MKNVFLLFIFVFVLSTFAEAQVISLNKPISAVSIWGAGYEADKANDGDLTTRWASNGDEGDKWIIIDLEEVSSIDAVRIVWEAAFSTDFTIDVSDDQSSWTTASTVTGNASAGQQDLTGLNASGRYVRLYSTAGSMAHLSIFEFTVYGADGIPEPVVTTLPISLNKPATGISIWSEGFEASNVTDGDLTSRWASKGHTDVAKWIYIDLEETYHIDSVEIIWEAAYGMDFTIDVSDDAAEWTVAKTIVGNNSAGLQSITDISGIGRYIRINITAGNPDHAHSSIYEFSVYGNKPVLAPISLNKPATAISIWSEGFEASNVTDGDVESRWASQGHTDVAKWIYIDLEEVYNIDSAQIIWEAAYGMDFTIDVSDDATNWTVAKNIMGNSSAGLQSITDIAATGRYIRINITAGNPDHAHSSIFEFSVFGSIVGTDVMDYSERTEGIKVYPNPTTEIFTVQTMDDSEASLSVYELTGRLVYTDRFVNKKVVNAKEIGTSGILIIKVDTETRSYSKKVIVR